MRKSSWYLDDGVLFQKVLVTENSVLPHPERGYTVRHDAEGLSVGR